MPRTVRFSQIVAACGRPKVHTLWVSPDRDPELKRGDASHRVMTVFRARGKADTATVGFDRGAGGRAQYLIFPKSLRRFAGAHVVGLKFDLLEQPRLTAAGFDAWKSSPAPAGKGSQSPVRASSPSSPARQGGGTATADASAPVKPRATSSPRTSRKTATSAKAVKTKSTSTDHPSSSGNSALARAARAALKELREGKSVAAYQRLERALDE